ncbi:tetraspanin 36 [Rhincodon typus]|uniref:tetraspanin 36 n=1 Tax=Rhincodon typus TaxID=259920 RepID=UPI0020305AD2|nr:tetraspanin 36 [Rhincodon typus]
MDCGVLTSKGVLLFLSLIFWTAGAVLAYVGAILLSTYKNYTNFFEDKYVVLPALVIIAIALVMFLIGVIGCCATLRESRFGLGLFMLVLLIIFAAEVSAFVLGFLYREKVHEGVDKTMTAVFSKYDGKNSESKTVDFLQKQMACCGLMNYTSWETTNWFIKGNRTLPLSCCKHQFSNCTGSPSHPELLNTAGCEMKLETGLESILSYAMLVILGFAIIKFFGMISICVISCREKQTDYQPLPSSGIYA